MANSTKPIEGGESAVVEAPTHKVGGEKDAADATEAARAARCRNYPYGFAYWDRETKRCLAIDFSSDSVFEP